MVAAANEQAGHQSSAGAAHKRAGDGLNRSRSTSDAQEGRNFRDVATAQPERLRPGMLYRSSAFHTSDLRARADVQAILNLRRTGKPCRKPTRMAQEFVKPSWIVARIRDRINNAPAPRCPNCEEHLKADGDEGGCGTAKVYHVDFCTTAFKLATFTSVPPKAMITTVKEKFKPGGNAQAVMTTSIANPDEMGYGEMYVLFLEKSKPAVSQAIRLVADAENLPLVFFCTHGKDRTGVLTMLVLNLCAVPEEAILDDYEESASVMTDWQDGDAPDIEPHLIQDAVLEVRRSDMERALQHLRDEYGGVERYLTSCGVETGTMQMIRDTLLKSEALSMSGAPAPAGAH